MSDADVMDEEQLIEFAIRASLEDVYTLPHQKHLCSLETASEENLKILAAIEQGDVFTIRAQHQHHKAFSERDRRGWLPLHRASVQPDSDLLDAVLLASPDLSLEEETGGGETGGGETAMTLAVQAGHVNNVKMLLRHGASPHNTNSKNESPLLLAVRSGCYDLVLGLVLGGAFVQQVCLKKWTALHEAAKLGCADILMLLLRHGGEISAKDGHGVTPLGIAAEFGHAEVLEILIEKGGDVTAQATNGDTVLYDATGSGNLDCINLLLHHGANPNTASLAFQLPIHRAAYEGHYLALKSLIPITTKRALRLSGMSPVHSAADGGHAPCLELLIEKGFDVNCLLGGHISDNYGDMRKSPLYFSVCNGDVTCAELLLRAGAGPDRDPLPCLLVAVRAARYELVRLLLAHGADVDCYFRVVCNSVFPTALQYCLQDQMMLRLLLNCGYSADTCFRCRHDLSETFCIWEQSITIKNDNNSSKVTFCDFVSVSWLKHLAGGVVRTLLDYVSHVHICSKMQKILEKQKEWPEICDIISNPRSLQHLCRLLIRDKMTFKKLNNPEFMSDVPFPPALKNYLIYREYDIYGRMTDM